MPNLQAKGTVEMRGLICAWLPLQVMLALCSHQNKENSIPQISPAMHANTHRSQRAGQIHTAGGAKTPDG